MCVNIRLSILFSLILLLTSCGKTELYTQLDEASANEMLSLLLRNDIQVEKMPGKKGMVSINVPVSEMGLAIEILKEHGYPKRQFKDMGEVFKKEGMVSSPTEEKARYVYAVSQEIAHTLSKIDGVLEARVHIVLPELSRTGDITNEASASVFIKHIEGVKLKSEIPKIKLFVNNSIEGLDYQKISVALFESKPISKHEFMRNKQSNGKELQEKLMIAAAVLIVLLLSGIAMFFALRKKS